MYQPIELGEIYEIDHNRKGYIKILVENLWGENNEWVDAIILDAASNRLIMGDDITIRRSLFRITKRKE